MNIFNYTFHTLLENIYHYYNIIILFYNSIGQLRVKQSFPDLYSFRNKFSICFEKKNKYIHI